jgi:poly(hydroxyalkanoate) depolymerase family esterase
MSIILSIKKHMKTSFLTMSLLLVSHFSTAEFFELKSFADNPGELTASYYLPTLKAKDSESLPLVVLLHGCAQQGKELAEKSGILGLAQQHKFALLLPQQGLTNNIKRCFNWYSPDDYTKDEGETRSIKNMITTLKQQISSDKVFIIGLSAGGAMASSMLVNYPELFTAGSVVAGIPFPCADGLIKGISCMKNGPSQTVGELVTLIENIHLKSETWPKLSIWTGTNDRIVNPLNSSTLAGLWAQLSNVISAPIVDKKPGYTITNWYRNSDVQVQLVEVADRTHGIMVNPNVENGGKESDYLLLSPVSTAKHVVSFWGL